MVLEKRYYSECSPVLIEKLRYLTLLGSKEAPGSGMSEVLDDLEHGYLKDKDVPMIIAHDDKTLYGWGLIAAPFYTNGKRISMIYVDPLFRRQGIGTKIAKRLNRYRDLYCYPWNDRAESFYDSVGMQAYWA